MPLKIVNILSRMNIGGPSLHAVLLTKYLDEIGYESLLISGSLSEGEGDMSYLIEKYGIKHLLLKRLKREISLYDDFRAVKELYRFFRKEKPYIVHTNQAKAGLVGRFAAWLARVPIILHTYHGHVFYGYFSTKKTLLYILIERFTALISTRVIAISEKIKNDICSVYKITSPQKISTIPLGFELNKMEGLENYRHSLRKRFSIPESAPTIGIIGRITAIKNQSLFVDIANLLLQLNNHVHFLIIGDGELREELELKVNKLGIGHHIHFTGWIKKTALMYADLDMMLLTSKNEGTPVTIIEAMYYKIPVICSNVGGNSDLITDGQTGFLVNSLIAKDYIPIIIKLLESAKERGKIGLAANEFIREKFDVNRLIADIRDLYTHLLEQKGISC